jgi:hypothetical protein
VLTEDIEEFKNCIRDASRDRDLEELESCKIEKDGVVYSADPGLPLFESNIFAQIDGSSEEYDMDLEVMDIDEYIDSQLARFEKRELKDFTPEEAYERGLEEEKLESMVESIEEGKPLPLPVIEYDEEGELEEFQEGRHRGEALKKAGREKIMTWIAKKCEGRGCGDRIL